MTKYEIWLDKVTDESLKQELLKIKDDSTEVENRFYKDLEFGTGGMRGIIGVGTNCLNIYTIRKATKGLSNYMKSIKGKSVAISYDSRINSELFAKNAAMVLAEDGFDVYLTGSIMPTPFVSFAVRHFKCDMGIMVTASHNPAKYNGYKVSGADGCQLTDADANILTGFIEKADGFDVAVKNFEDYKNINIVNGEAINLYLENVHKQHINKPSNLKVVYTPLNGAGHKLVPEIFKMIGQDDVVIVAEQGYPDGNFPTCPYPNPEKAEALRLGLEYAKKNNADILIATDPDADRVGAAVLHKGEYRLISGNEMGVLLCQYILSQKTHRGCLPKNPVVIKTIVTSTLTNKVAKSFGAEIIDVLTGFKYIGEQITLLEKQGKEDRFVFGFEESYGYLAGTYVRDKDAVVTSMLVAEMASFYKNNGKTLIDVLDDIYVEFGHYYHKIKSIEFPGAAGSVKMKQLLADLRKKDLKEMNGLKIIETVDYLTQKKQKLPPSNVLVFNMEGNSQFIVRPSGTEPLIKFYLTAVDDADEIFAKMEKFISEFFK